MTLSTYTYCTEAELLRRYGHEALVNWTDHDLDGVQDTGVLDDAINQATAEINLYACKWYSQAALDADVTINRWCVTLAAYFASTSRANPPPDILAVEYNRIMEQLKLLAAGVLTLDGLAMRADLRPSMDNVLIDRRYRHSKQRVTRPNSTDAPSTLPIPFATEPPVIMD